MVSIGGVPGGVGGTLVFTFGMVAFFIVSLLRGSTVVDFGVFRIDFILVVPLVITFSLGCSPLAYTVTNTLSNVVVSSTTTGICYFGTVILLVVNTNITIASGALFGGGVPSILIVSLLYSVLCFVLR